jgi:hypothetical protein
LHTDIIATNHQIYSEARDIVLKENRIRLNIYDADLTDRQREVFSMTSELYIWTPSLHLANNSFIPILQSRSTPVKYLKLGEGHPGDFVPKSVADLALSLHTPNQ